jgi:hypothetical protein
MRKNEESMTQFGLMANGSCGLWNIEVDESLDGDAWTMSIDGPQIYVVFRLQDLEVPRKTLGFLNSQIKPPPSRTSPKRPTSDSVLRLGRLGSAPVALLRDDEVAARYFILIGGKGRSAVRVSLHAEDVRSWVGALSEMVKDLYPASTNLATMTWQPSPP